MAELQEIAYSKGLHYIVFCDNLRITVMRDFDANKQPAIYIRMPYAIRPTEVEQFNAALQRAQEIAAAWAAESEGTS